jgi:acyl-CoA synthetase (AMP-forming)/AMP-acid ligase II
MSPVAGELRQRVGSMAGLVTTMVRARMIAPLRPDRYARIAWAMARENMGITSGFAAAAQRCPNRTALIDERGALTWREIDQRGDALASALQHLPGGAPQLIAIMVRNHRGFVDSLIAANRVGAEILLLNTSFAGPAMADVINREGVGKSTAVIYDDEFAGTVSRALADSPEAVQIVAHTGASTDQRTLDSMIADHENRKPARPQQRGRIILLTSGTTGVPKGAKHSGGDVRAVKSILDRTPWRAQETTVVVAPMFQAWGFGQLALSAMLACTVFTRRKFDPEATLALVDAHAATGLCVVPVMLDRITDLPDDVRNRYSGKTLRSAAASGSRMRPDVVTRFMDQFGDIIYNNYNATEAGMIATATPADLRIAPDTAGLPADGTELRIFDADMREPTAGEVGTIYVRNSTQFDGYTTGVTKNFSDGFMNSGDVGYLDGEGRLFVIGRDDEMIVSGGENIYPIEVEKTLAAHPAAAEAAVLGVDDDSFGQRLVAFVVFEAGSSVTPDALKAHVRDNLANYKVPRSITVLDALPRGSTGKISRHDLQERLEGRDPDT